MRCLNEIQEERQITPERAAKLWTIDNTGTPCRILSRRIDDDGNVLYMVQYVKAEDDEETDVEQEQWTESGWIVREAISFLDIPYTTGALKDGEREDFVTLQSMFSNAYVSILCFS